MLTVRDLMGNEELLTDFKELTLNRKVNGEKVISLTILPTQHNEHSFPKVEEESILTFNNEEYVIKKVSGRGIGNTFIKRVEAIHKIYVDLINKQQPRIHNGSMTFANYLSFVFDGTGYTFSIIDSFNAQSFENLGNDNRLALLQKGLERYKAEMDIWSTNIRFKKKVGNDTDIQFRYGHNIKSIEKNVDTTNLATVIRGTGAEGISAYYRSPNADIFGEIDAPPVNDERFTSQETLLEEMKARLEDTPEFSITIDFVDLRAAGYPWTVPNEGDRVFIIYEPMNDLLIETRILEITEVYDVNFNVIKTNVTLANYKKTFAGTMFDNVNKRLRDIVNDDGIVRYNALDEWVKIATEAIKSAQTELVFENGIIARDKNNPNFLVVLNSNGLGISRDGGQTFKDAITSEGFVLSAGAIGQLNANNIQIGAATTFEEGYDPTKIVGVNLLLNSSFEKDNPDIVQWKSQFVNSVYIGLNEPSAYKGEKVLFMDSNGGDVHVATNMFVKLEEKTWYTISYYYRLAGHVTESSSYIYIDGNSVKLPFTDGVSNDKVWRRSVTQFYNDTGKEMQLRFGYWCDGYSWANFDAVKVEMGRVATPYSPSLDETVREDLRLTAPLPTSLTLNQDGIRATTSNPNKYAQMDYRGFYAKQGAFAVERPDGYLSVQDGIMQHGFAVQGSTPTFKTANVEEIGQFYRTATQNRFENVQRFTFKHDSRYLRIIANMSVDGGTDMGNVGYINFDVFSDDETQNIATATVTETRKHANQGYRKEVLIDLGVPTGQILVCYWRMNSSKSYFTYGSVRYIAQEG
ncbi:phage tail protein [Bacillus sp. 1P02SD]|uniref:phage tail protein n=1 Tax=Bacillus sp. 1P02SD TaxID=3132264 RepID=UPI0039A2B71A